jgi:hypothetical protein
MEKKIKNISLILVLTLLYSCTGGYSFTGADISADIKSFSVDNFENRAPLVQPTLSNTFTEALIDRFLSQTSLELVGSNGDLNFEGEITNYRVSPQAFTGDERAALNRLTISIRVKFTNTQEPTKSFDTSFSRYADFESTVSLSAVEEELIREIVDQITEDIFIRSVANW